LVLNLVEFATYSFFFIVLFWYYQDMPPKIRDLISDLERAGFRNRGGKGSHRNYRHPAGVNITISGKLGDDAKQYLIRNTRRVIELVSDEKK